MNREKFRHWKAKLEDIKTILSTCPTKIIVACRLEIYKDEHFRRIEIFNTCVCDLTSYKLRLSKKERSALANSCLHTYTTDILDCRYDFFPLLCKLYSKNSSQLNVSDFFDNPFSVYKSELDKYRDHEEGRNKYYALAICVVFNNRVKESVLCKTLNNKKYTIFKNVRKTCCIQSKLSTVAIRDEMNTLLDTYLKKENGVYSVIHDRLFDFMVSYFAKKMPECLIQNASSVFVRERFWLHKKEGNSNCVNVVPPNLNNLYIKRVIMDWAEGKIDDVFCNINFELKSFINKLLEHLNALENSKQIMLANKVDKRGNTPLIQCCFIGDNDLLEWLLKHNVDINQCRSDDVTALFVACQEDHLTMAKKLLEKNAFVNKQISDGATPLFIACQKKHLPLVDILLSKDANVNLCTKDGSTPLIVSAKLGHSEIAKRLLKEKINFKQTLNDSHKTAVSIARENKHDNIADMIEDKMAGNGKINMIITHRYIIVRLLVLLSFLLFFVASLYLFEIFDMENEHLLAFLITCYYIFHLLGYY